MIGNQVVSTMFDIKSSIHMARFIPHRDWDEDPGLGSLCYLLFPGCDGDHLSILIYICHIDPLCIDLWLCFVIS
jgi:hypothetical protein